MAKSRFGVFKASALGAAAVPASGANKFSAKVTICAAGHRHDSKGEAKRCGELTMLERAGVIHGLIQQPQYWFEIDGRPVVHENGRRVGYRADFGYTEGGVTVAEDFKGGYRDSAWTLRKAMFRALFPHVELREVKR